MRQSIVRAARRRSRKNLQLGGPMLNAVLALILVTSILGLVLTERFAPRTSDREVRKEVAATG
jgi:hypothetical protein